MNFTEVHAHNKFCLHMHATFTRVLSHLLPSHESLTYRSCLPIRHGSAISDVDSAAVSCGFVSTVKSHHNTVLTTIKSQKLMNFSR